MQDLTKDQEAALAYSEQGQNLVIGGPGTGKTVVMVNRAMQLEKQGADYIFLVYNHMLHEASQQMSNEEDGQKVQFESSTWIRWFCGKFRKLTGEEDVPLKDSSDFYSFDWKECVRIAEESSKYVRVNENRFFLIDEGQDMPLGFYQTLYKFGYQNFFVAADQNQQIWKDRNSSRMDLENVLAIDTTEVIKLKHNFRNNHAIARLAQEFYTGDSATRPIIPPSKGRLHIPILYVFKDRPGVYEKVAEEIVSPLQRDNQRLIGVLAPNDKVRTKYFYALREATDRLIGNSLQVYTYKHGMNPEVRFDQGGIVVLNAQSCKGLEFDTVILADIDEHNISRGKEDDTKKLFYVMVSRARDKVFMLMKNSEHPIYDILPEDQSILKHQPWNI